MEENLRKAATFAVVFTVLWGVSRHFWNYTVAVPTWISLYVVMLIFLWIGLSMRSYFAFMSHCLVGPTIKTTITTPEPIAEARDDGSHERPSLTVFNAGGVGMANVPPYIVTAGRDPVVVTAQSVYYIRDAFHKIAHVVVSAVLHNPNPDIAANVIRGVPGFLDSLIIYQENARYFKRMSRLRISFLNHLKNEDTEAALDAEALLLNKCAAAAEAKETLEDPRKAFQQAVNLFALTKPKKSAWRLLVEFFFRRKREAGSP